MQPSDFPLTWPEGRQRTPARDRLAGRFTIAFEVAYDALVHEAEKLHDAEDRDIVVSTNVPIGTKGLPLVSASRHHVDPGVAVYIWHGGQPYAVACDTYREVRHNLRAIWAVIQSMRTIQRHATGALLAQSMSGFCREVGTAEVPIGRRIAAGK
jgi:hypothetical protein